jgi:hypothetical protein
VVTEIRWDESIRRRALDTSGPTEAGRWETLIEQVLALPPSYRLRAAMHARGATAPERSRRGAPSLRGGAADRSAIRGPGAASRRFRAVAGLGRLTSR